ncbi:hypothetical protein LLH00_04100 [bacterium]|nr:hypothetical protein [bacterium]
MLRFILKWGLMVLVVYLLWQMIVAKPQAEKVSEADLVGKLIEHTDILKDSQGKDILEPKIKDGTVDKWLTAGLLRTGALVLSAAGDPPDSAACRRSLKYIRAAAMLDSLDSEADQFLAYALWGLGDRQSAIVACERAVSRCTPQDTTLAPAWLGSLYLEEGRTDSALACFRSQLRLDPRNETYYNDTRYYLTRAGVPADTLEAVLSLSEVHTGLFKRAGRAYNEMITWPRRKLAGMLR